MADLPSGSIAINAQFFKAPDGSVWQYQNDIDKFRQVPTPEDLARKLDEYTFEEFDAFGDSITAGLNATAIGKRYPNLMSDDLNLIVNNKAVAGQQVSDQQIPIYAQSVSLTNQLFTLMIGTNDTWIYGTDPDKKDNFKSFHAAAIAYLSITDAKKIFGQSSDVTYAGTWTNSAYYGGAKSKQSSTNGSTATFTKYGDILYIAHTISNTNGGTFTVTIDGINKGTFVCQGKNGTSITTNAGKTYGSSLLRFDGLGDIIHTVVITVTSSTSSSNVVCLDWIGSSRGNQQTTAPLVVVGGVPRQLPNSIGRDEFTQAYTNIIKDNILIYGTDGLNILYADTPSFIIPITDITTPGDNVHPNDLGMFHLYQAFMSTINLHTRYNTKLNLMIGGVSGGTSDYFKQNLNAFGTTANIGTADNNSLVVKTNSLPAISINNSQSVNIGTSNPAGVSFSVTKKIDGSGGIGSYFGGNASSTAAAIITGISTFIGADAGSTGITRINHINISQGTLSSPVVDQFGLSISSNLTGASGINGAITSNIPVGTNRWNLYIVGTAYNYLSGRVLIGSSTDLSYKLQVTGTSYFSSDITCLGRGSFGGVLSPGVSLSSTSPITGATSSIGIYSGGTVQNDVTNANYISTFASVATGAVLSILNHISVSQGTFNGSVADQRGISISGNLIAGTNTNTGIYSNLNASGLKNWNIYFNGDALNRVNGFFGVKTDPTALLHLGAETSAFSAFKFTIPTVQTTAPEVGALGVAPTGDDLTFVISTAGQRKKIVLQDGTLTTGRVPVVTTNGRLVNSPITTAELGFLTGLTQNVENKLNFKNTVSDNATTMPTKAYLNGAYPANTTTGVGLIGYEVIFNSVTTGIGIAKKIDNSASGDWHWIPTMLLT